MRLIIVDDHALFREGLASIIRSEPDVEIAGMAGSVREAVEMARAVKPDMILMDFSMPDGTGADATRQILSENPACKIVFLTMSEEDDNLFDAIRAGAKGYLLKEHAAQQAGCCVKVGPERGERPVAQHDNAPDGGAVPDPKNRDSPPTRP